MEQFNEPHRRVREKNVYLLHLDTARIVLISFAIIGVIVASFLLGMNFMKTGEPHGTPIAGNDILSKQGNDMALVNPDLPDLPVTDEGIDSDKNKSSETAVKKEQDEKAQGQVSQKTANPAEIMTSENINEMIHAPKNNTKTAADHGKTAVSQKNEAKSHVNAKRNDGSRDNRRKEKNRVVEVSSETDKEHHRGAKIFSIQIASYDTKSRAMSEVERLKDMNIDAHIDKKKINGRSYYRVRVGPIQSHSRAEKLLEEIHETHRYGESFMVLE